ncbi:MAG: hypothetical protein DMF81_10170 [Acidobacteria bacterium]|nr:MAG: hypothetical protein DMF81_10170 [Acidobacteriota bacterium]
MRPSRPSSTTAAIAAGGAMRSPKAWKRILATLAATSIPTSSMSARGPTGKPKAVIAPSTASMAAPSSTRRAASLM